MVAQGKSTRACAGDYRPVDGAVFRRVMGVLPTGVSVLTAARGGEVRGITVGSLTSLSLAPPLVLVCLRRESTTLGLLGHGGRFGLSILAAGQSPVADAFARPDRDTVPVELSTVDDLPVVAGAAGWLACVHRHTFSAGDHAIVIGEVTRAEPGGGEPLVRHASRYRRLDPWPRAA